MTATSSMSTTGGLSPSGRMMRLFREVLLVEQAVLAIAVGLAAFHHAVISVLDEGDIFFARQLMQVAPGVVGAGELDQDRAVQAEAVAPRRRLDVNQRHVAEDVGELDRIDLRLGGKRPVAAFLQPVGEQPLKPAVDEFQGWRRSLGQREACPGVARHPA